MAVLDLVHQGAGAGLPVTGQVPAPVEAHHPATGGIIRTLQHVTGVDGDSGVVATNAEPVVLFQLSLPALHGCEDLGFQEAATVGAIRFNNSLYRIGTAKLWRGLSLLVLGVRHEGKPQNDRKGGHSRVKLLNHSQISPVVFTAP